MKKNCWNCKHWRNCPGESYNGCGKDWTGEDEKPKFDANAIHLGYVFFPEKIYTRYMLGDCPGFEPKKKEQ